MSASDVERLAVLIEANTKQYERSMKRLEQKTDRAIKASRRSIDGMSVSFGKLAGMAKTFAATFGGVALSAGLTGLSSSIADLVADASKLAKTADLIGISTDDLQRIQYGFGLAGVSISEAETALQQFGKRLSEAESKGGLLADILAKNGVSLRNARGEMKPLVQLLEEYADLMKNAKSSQDRLSLANEAFGRSGNTMILALRGGADGVRDLMGEVEEAGGVLDEELLRKMEVIDDRFAELTHTIGTNLKSAILSAVSGVDELVQSIQNSGLVEWINEIENAGGEAEFKAMLQMAADADVAANAIQSLQRDIDVLKERVALNLELGFDTSEAERRLDTFLAKLNALKTSPAELGKMARLDIPAATKEAFGVDFSDTSPFPPSQKPSQVKSTIIPSRASGSSRDSAQKAAAADRQREAVERVIAALEFEQETLGKSELQQRIMNEIRSAGAGATDEQRARITSLVTEIENQEQATARLAEVTGFFEDQAMTAFGNVTAMISTGNSALDQFLQKMADAAYQAIAFGEGPLASLFGGGSSGGGFLSNLFAGFFADGGKIPSGQFGVVGEAGPELISGPATVTPLSKAGGSSGSQSVQVFQSFQISGTVTDKDVQAMIEQGKAQTVAAVRSSFGGMVQRYQADGALS